ncbi:serine/threonine protein kinase [Solirubrobacter sp. CPCC 204708]|uniref:Serine/threonine protein kinase n=1 Tax=Solirubrobacter deserti TaxID=2282478 RepID=A0ABT4RTL8_9ACTN|nr:serine/threonine-protein kinase [Solirubrobacter deserti]MBE2318334.1 serine/threonine protein kinase [Solirubrobacter deserti]MDA0141933.1 serine/threonine protein kinase [Solirubrobacter deserti]
MCAVAAENDLPSRFSPGDVVDGYRIEARLGGGGFGEVFLAAERSPKRKVARKFIRPELALAPDLMRRFEREVDAMASVEHPNVVPIYARGEHQGRRYFSMRYVPGGSLDRFLSERRPAFEDVLELLAGVAEGLDCCHARGVVHRDLKPANILIDAEHGRGLLTDFGIALADDVSTVTGTGRVPGTPAYMAPETLMYGAATAASDRWALAAIAYRAATGTLPRGLTQPADAEPVAPSRRNQRLNPAVDRVLLRALSLDPAKRHGDARTLVADLHDALERPHQAIPRTAGVTREPRARRRGLTPKRMWSVAGTAIVLTPALVYGVASLASPDCHPSYAGACLRADSSDYDCRRGDGNGPDYIGRTVRVVGPDVYELDRDRDGYGC